MLWSTLFNRIGKQPLKTTQHNHVYAVLENPKTHITERVYLELKYDTSGKPYLVRANKNYAENKPYYHKKKGDKQYAHNSHSSKRI